MTLVVLVLTYNSESVIRKCLESLKDSMPKNVLVVDNASTDATVKLVKCQFPRVTVFILPRNTGYAAGNNLGIKKALQLTPDYVLILNPDTILDKNCLKELLKDAEAHVGARVLGPKIYSDAGKKMIWSVGGELDKNRYTAKLIGLGEKDKGQYDKGQQVDFVSGTCMLIPRQVLETGARFYEPYFMYYEDVEFCVRTRKIGYTSVVVPEAKLVHYEVSNSHDTLGAKLVNLPGWKLLKNYYLARNHLLFVERNAPIRVKLREILRLPKTVFEHVLQQDTQSLKGVRDYYMRKYGEYEYYEKEGWPKA